MNRLRFYGALAFVAACASLALAACAPLGPTPTSTAIAQASPLDDVEAAYLAAVSSENLYLKSGRADKATVKMIENYRGVAHILLAPIEATTAAGGTPTDADIAAAKAAIGVFAAEVAKHQ